jgi:hypothetical protein
MGTPFAPAMMTRERFDLQPAANGILVSTVIFWLASPVAVPEVGRKL